MTLLLTPDDAERLALAQSAGGVTLVLRNPLDLVPTDTRGVRLASLMGDPGSGAGRQGRAGTAACRRAEARRRCPRTGPAEGLQRGSHQGGQAVRRGHQVMSMSRTSVERRVAALACAVFLAVGAGSTRAERAAGVAGGARAGCRAAACTAGGAARRVSEGVSHRRALDRPVADFDITRIAVTNPASG